MSSSNSLVHRCVGPLAHPGGEEELLDRCADEDADHAVEERAAERTRVALEDAVLPLAGECLRSFL